MADSHRSELILLRVTVLLNHGYASPLRNLKCTRNDWNDKVLRLPLCLFAASAIQSLVVCHGLRHWEKDYTFICCLHLDQKTNGDSLMIDLSFLLVRTETEAGFYILFLCYGNSWNFRGRSRIIAVVMGGCRVPQQPWQKTKKQQQPSCFSHHGCR